MNSAVNFVGKPNRPSFRIAFRREAQQTDLRSTFLSIQRPHFAPALQDHARGVRYFADINSLTLPMAQETRVRSALFLPLGSDGPSRSDESESWGSEGGHDVPEAVVRRRFDRSIHNFLLLYRSLGDSWTLFDNSGATPAVIAFEKQGSTRIMNREVYDSLIARYGRP